MGTINWIREHEIGLLLIVLAIGSLYMVWQPVVANDRISQEPLPCPEDLLPPLYPVGPLCVPACTKIQEFGDYIGLTMWDMALAEGPAPGVYFVHIYIREGWWEIKELFAMNHFGPSEEIKVMYHDGLEWHGLGGQEQVITYDEEYNVLTITPVPQYQAAYINYDGIIVGPGMEIGAVWRLGHWNPWDKFPRDLRFNLTLQRTADIIP